MVPHAGCGRKNLLLLLLLISLATITTQAKADFTPPSLTTWIGSGETTGIFTTGKITYNITSGEQPHPTITQIALRSNTSQPINLGTCVADFRLVRLEANDTLTTTDYAYHTISSINAINGVFWASMIHDYPSTYKFGLVIWNVSDGSVVGRLVATIEATSEPLVKLTTDKTEYTPSDTIHYTMVNCGPQVMTSSMCFVYRQVGGGWVLVNKLGSADFPQKRIVVSKEKPYLGKISSSYADLSQSGVYKVVKGYAASVPGENGQASAEFRINSTSIIFPFREYSVLVWSLLGGASGLLLYYMIRRAKGYPRASGDSVEVTPIIYNRLQDSRTQKRLGIIFVIVLILGYISPCPQIPPTWLYRINFVGESSIRRGNLLYTFKPSVVSTLSGNLLNFKLIAENLGDECVVFEYGSTCVPEVRVRAPGGFRLFDISQHSVQVGVEFNRYILPGESFTVEWTWGLDSVTFPTMFLPGVYWISARHFIGRTDGDIESWYLETPGVLMLVF